MNDVPIGDVTILALAKASRFLHIDCLDMHKEDTHHGSLFSAEAEEVLFTALEDNYSIEELISNYDYINYRAPERDNLCRVLVRNKNLKLLANKLDNNEYLPAGEIEPLLRVIEDKSIDVRYIKNARERIGILYLATELLGEGLDNELRGKLPFDPDDVYRRHLDFLYDDGFNALMFTVANRYFKGSITISDIGIATKIFELVRDSGELKPTITDMHTAIFIADNLSAEKINTVIKNFKNIEKHSNAIEFFKAHPSKIGGFLVMPMEKLGGIIKSAFESENVYKEVSANPNLLFNKYGIRMLIAEWKNKEFEENSIVGQKRSSSFVKDLTNRREDGAQKSGRFMPHP